MADAGPACRRAPGSAGPPARHAAPRFPEIIYEQDYGYLEGTSSPDGEPVDVFVGTAGGGVTGVILSVDLTKQDCELKLLLGCSEQEMQSIEAFFNRHSSIAGKLVRRKE